MADAHRRSARVGLASALVVLIVLVGNVVVYVLRADHPIWQVVALGALVAASVTTAAGIVPMVREILRETIRRPHETSIIERQGYGLRSPVRVVPVSDREQPRSRAGTGAAN